MASVNGVSIATAYGWLLRSEEETKKGGYRPQKLLPGDVEFMLRLVEQKPTITFQEIKLKLG